MNKKAILISETLRIILALGVILLLVYLAVSLYGLFRTQTEIEQAKIVLDRIIQKVNLLQEGEEDSYLVVGPKDWYFIGNNNALCFCPDLVNKQSCFDGEKGICRVFAGFFINIEHTCENPAPGVLGSSHCFSLEYVPINFILERKGENVNIYSQKEKETNKESEIIFQKMLEYKKDGITTIKDLSIDVINSEGIINNYLKERKLKNLLKEFFSKESLYGYVMIGQKDSKVPADEFFFIIKIPKVVSEEINQGKREAYSGEIDILDKENKVYELSVYLVKK